MLLASFLMWLWLTISYVPTLWLFHVWSFTPCMVCIQHEGLYSNLLYVVEIFSQYLTCTQHVWSMRMLARFLPCISGMTVYVFICANTNTSCFIYFLIDMCPHVWMPVCTLCYDLHISCVFMYELANVYYNVLHVFLWLMSHHLFSWEWFMLICILHDPMKFCTTTYVLRILHAYVSWVYDMLHFFYIYLDVCLCLKCFQHIYSMNTLFMYACV